MPKRHTLARKAGPREQAGKENEWQLQDAKARFSEVFRRVRERGPQRITKHGKEAVVMIPAEEYERLAGRRRRGSLAEFLARSPLAGSGITLDREPEYGRPVEL